MRVHVRIISYYLCDSKKFLFRHILCGLLSYLAYGPKTPKKKKKKKEEEEEKKVQKTISMMNDGYNFCFRPSLV
jgi:hypothetical protein